MTLVPSQRDRQIIFLNQVHPIKEVQHTSVADQQELIRILSCEIQNKWLKALGMPPVPSFSLSQNNEVLRRMALGTILICENIFKVCTLAVSVIFVSVWYAIIRVAKAKNF